MGVELGSTNIKACLIGPDHQVFATGSHGWENQFVQRLWTYSEDAIWTGLEAAVGSLMADVERPTACLLPASALWDSRR